MTARILVVDDIAANVKLLEARLLAEYFDVLTAVDGYSALKLCATTQVDLVLLDVMMPGIDGFEVCERLKTDPATAHIPVVMVTALDQPSDRVRGLKVGADDFLTKPVNDLQLIARVKSLLRLKALSDELRIRSEATRPIMTEDILKGADGRDEPANVLLVDARPGSQERIVRALKPIATVEAIADPPSALVAAAEKPFDLVIVNAASDGYDPLRLCSQLRSLERTRFLPLLIVTEISDENTVIRALDLGVNDYIIRPIDPNELVARALTQIRRKRYHARLRSSLRQTMELAVIDPLTGLYNRRYLDTNLKLLFDRAATRGRSLSLCICDVDRFKLVNDTYGHDVGDEVLRELARRLRGAVRGADLACRYGGEEFVIVMPDTDADATRDIAERLRNGIESHPFRLQTLQKTLPVTASFGIASTSSGIDNAEQLFKQADLALYQAKSAGRNRVVAAAA